MIHTIRISQIFIPQFCQNWRPSSSGSNWADSTPKQGPSVCPRSHRSRNSHWTPANRHNREDGNVHKKKRGRTNSIHLIVLLNQKGAFKREKINRQSGFWQINSHRHNQKSQCSSEGQTGRKFEPFIVWSVVTYRGCRLGTVYLRS